MSPSWPGEGRATTWRRWRPDAEQTGGLIEPDGRWLGGASAALGLSGTVEGAALRALFSGVDPTTGELLADRHARVRVAAYDCTYSTPKSVSLLHALGPKDVRDHVRAGHEEAAEAALGYLERRGARVRRSPSRGEPTESVPASGFVAAAFLHRTSRAPDPHLHSHVLVANLAQGPDGRWSALDGRGIYLELGAARDLYETQLRSELTRRLGVSWRELQGSWADLGGIDPNVVRAFSRRSAEIAAALEQSGLTGPRARRLAAVRTRPEKDLGTPYEELVSEWRERAYRLGVSDTRLAAVSGRTRTGSAMAPSGSASAGVPEPGVGPRPEGSTPEPWAERALGERGVAARDGTFRRGDLVRARCATLPSGAPVGDVERDVDAVVAEGRVVPVPGAAGRPGLTLKAPSSSRPIPAGFAEPLYTTPELLALQERMRKLVQDHPGAVELLAYHPGERLAALDSLGRLLSGPQAQIAAVAPARNAAASFEAVTGIETTPVAALRRTASAPVAALRRTASAGARAGRGRRPRARRGPSSRSLGAVRHARVRHGEQEPGGPLRARSFTRSQPRACRGPGAPSRRLRPAATRPGRGLVRVAVERVGEPFVRRPGSARRG